MSASITQKPVKLSYWIHAIIFVALTVGIGFLPPFAGISEYGMDILGLFVGLIYGWSFIGFLWPSLFGFIVLGFSNYSADITTAVSMGFGESLVWQVFFMMLFTEILSCLGLTQYLGFWMISRKFCVGRPWVFVFVIFTTSWIVGGLTSPYAVAFMLWSVLYGIFEQVGLEKRSASVTYIIGGIMFLAAMACMIFPFEPYPTVVLGLCAGAGATTIPFVPWLITGVLSAFLFSIIYLLVGKFVFRFDLSPLARAGETISTKKMTKDNKIGLSILLIFIVIMFLIGILSKDIPVISFFNRINLVGLAVIAICVTLFWKRKDGSSLVTFNRLLNGVSWEIVVMFAITIPLGNAMESEETGIMTSVLGALTPFFNTLSPAVFVFVVIIALGLLTQICHNLVLTIAFTPMLATLALNYNLDPLLMGFLVVTILQCATATPAASAQAAAVFANDHWVSAKWCYISGCSFAIISIAVMALVIYPVGRILF